MGPIDQRSHSSRSGSMSAMDIMRRAMRVRFGGVADDLADPTYHDSCFQMTQDAFIFRTEGGVAYSYALGDSLVAYLPDEELRDEFDLYLWGTVFGAVAWLNGFIPLHASAVAIDGRVIAFTADSGVGKSTLAAALAARPGFVHVCDDTMVLDCRSGQVLAVPDGKAMKLWDDAFRLADADRKSPITSMPGKFYAAPASQANEALPLADLVFLAEGDRISLEPVKGASKLSMLTQSLYRAFVHVGRDDPAHHAEHLIAIASKVRFWRLGRPRCAATFTKQLAEIEQLVRNLGANQ